MQKVLEVKGLSKKYGDHLVLDNITFEIEEGAIVGVIGSSGCGKTTLLNSMIGVIKPEAGKIFYKDKDVTKENIELIKNVGFAVQESSIYSKLNVMENIEYFGRLAGIPNKSIKERSDILLNTFGLTDARHVLGGNLSIGMQKRVDIACSLIHDPEILILDEPTANLDPVMRKNIMELIKKINDSGTTIILSSHILTDVSNLCHKVLILNNKKAAAFDSPANLELNFSKHNLIKIESELGNYTNLISLLYNASLTKKHQIDENTLSFFTKDVKTTLKMVNKFYSKSNDNLVNINIIKPSLDMIFEHISNSK